MQIESIKPGRRDKSKLILHFTDGSYAETAAEDSYMLKVGQDISSEYVLELSKKYREHKAKKSAANSLSHRNMSSHELLRKLRERGYSDEEAEKAARWLEDIGAIDDERYAAQCAAYYKNRGYGALRIREELRRRGIPRDMAEEIIDELPGSENEITSLIEKKLRGEELTPDKKRKIVAMLTRRGFKYDEIRAGFLSLALDSEDIE